MEKKFYYMVVENGVIVGTIDSYSVVDGGGVYRLSPNQLYDNKDNLSFEPVVGYLFDEATDVISAPNVDLTEKKEQLCSQIKDIAKGRIEQLEWRFTRYAEQRKMVELHERADTDDKEWYLLGLRDSYRTQSNTLEAEVNALTTEQELDEYIITFDDAPSIAEPTYNKLTKLALLSRFTGDEYKNIKDSTIGDVMLLSTMLEASTFIDITDPRTVAGIGALATLGILTEERKNVILQPGTAADSYII